MLDIRTAQDRLEDVLRDAILYALGKRIATVSNVSNLRAFVTQGQTGGVLNNDSLAVIVVGGLVTASYRWSQESVAADNGTTVIKPDDITFSGRWIAWTSTIRFSPQVGGDSFLLHEIPQGPLERVIVLNKSMDGAEISALISGQVPSAMIEATDDIPEDMTLDTGYRWDTRYEFTVSVIAQNLRDRRQSTHGSTLDPSIGANLLDGFIKALFGGTNITPEESGIRNIQVGRGMNWYSTEAQRRVIRSRGFTIQATEANPQAPNEVGPAQEVDAQAELTDLGDHADESFDISNYVSGGMTVGLGPGLTKTVTAGTAQLAGLTVTYAGQLKTFTASVDTYRDLLPNGSMVFVEAAFDQDVAVTPNAMRVGMTRTDGSGVLSDRMIAETRIPFMNPLQIPLT